MAKGVMNRHFTSAACKYEYDSQVFSRFNERPIEFGFVFRKLGELYPKTVLDVGTGTTALPHLMRNCGFLVTATDNIRDYWQDGMFNRHFHVIDDDITNTRLSRKFDLITCISVLEHIVEADQAVKNMLQMLNEKGHLLLTFPYNEDHYVKNVYELPGSSYGQGNPFITQSYARSNIEKWLSLNGGRIVDQEYWQYWDGELWTVGNQIIPPRKVSVGEKHQLTCIHIQKD